MGCDYSTRTRTEPEDHIRHYESKSSFCALSPHRLEYVAIKYAPDRNLTETQVRKVWEKLEISTKQQAKQDWSLEYRSTEGWDRNGLFTAAVLLSAGSAEEKCAVLFWLFVPGGGEFMDKGQGHNLSVSMMRAAISATPRLVPQKYRQAETFEQYITGLKRKEAAASAQLHSLLFASAAVLTVSSLAAVFGGVQVCLLTLHGLRRYTEECSEQALRLSPGPPKPAKRLRFAQNIQEGPQSSSLETSQKPILKRTLTIA